VKEIKLKLSNFIDIVVILDMVELNKKHIKLFHFLHGGLKREGGGLSENIILILSVDPQYVSCSGFSFVLRKQS
jgi:hypothetical protein